MIFFKGQKAVPWTRANRDVADQDFSDLQPSVSAGSGCSKEHQNIRPPVPDCSGARPALGPISRGPTVLQLAWRRRTRDH